MIKTEKNKFTKDTLNVIRTTMRNNIELTHIADNKANVLLSLSALMITFMVPFAIPYLDMIVKYNLGFPLTLLVITCFVTIYIAALVLKPGKFDENHKDLENGQRVSPFFFGNFYKMNKVEFSDYIESAVANGGMLRYHITEDLHFIGRNLGKKMGLIRIAFNIFLVGLFLSIVMSFTCLLIFG